jgi:hypothetical protein
VDGATGHAGLLHDCQPPTDRGRPIEDGAWVCPVCGAPWGVAPRSSSNPAHPIAMATPMGLVSSEWIRGAAIRHTGNGAGGYVGRPAQGP